VKDRFRRLIDAWVDRFFPPQLPVEVNDVAPWEGPKLSVSEMDGLLDRYWKLVDEGVGVETASMTIEAEGAELMKKKLNQP
jgi:hypothetical protein